MENVARILILLGGAGTLEFVALTLSIHQVNAVPIGPRLRRRMQTTVVRNSPLLAMASALVLAAGILDALVSR